MVYDLQPTKSYGSYPKIEVPRLITIAPMENRQNLSLNLKDSTPRKYTYKNLPYTSGAQSVSIARRNARERNRVKQVNDSFNALRKRLPASVIAALSGGSRRGSGKKLSKVDTLRMVLEYIRHLQTLLEDGKPENTNITPMYYSSGSLPEIDEGIYGGSSPYTDSIPSPLSECSSGISTSYHQTQELVPNCEYPNTELSSPMDEDLIDAISWWQQ